MPASFLALTGWHDVLHEILNQLERPYEDDDDAEDSDGNIYLDALRDFRNTLLSLALSCRAFLDPSLDKLWHDLENIHPLLQLLPNYQRRDESIYRLTGDIPPAAWSRLQAYARRVRNICLYTMASLDSRVWPTILEQCQGTLLFPNLRELSMALWPATHDSFNLVCRLAPPSLRYLFLSVEPEKGQDKATIAALVGVTLQGLSERSPGLVELSFFPHMTVAREHLLCLSQFTKMERLLSNSHATLDETILRGLSNLENLTEIRASILFRESEASAQLNSDNGFRKLTQLALRCQPTHLARFMLSSPMPRLNDLSLRLSDHPGDDFLTHFPSICQHIGPHTLTHLRVELGGFVHPPPLLINILEPLLSFAHLEKLELFFEEHLPLRDEDLERLARAWPNLCALILIQSETTLSDPDRIPGSVARPTLHGLAKLAGACPQLTKICIPDLDASSVLPADSVPLMEHDLVYLCIQNLVGAEEGETQLAVAVALDRLFPRLKLVRGGLEEMPGYGESPNPFLEDSQNVTLLLRAMQIARKRYSCGS